MALTLLLVEGALRLAGIHFAASMYTEDAERGYALRPGAEGWSTAENDVYWHINRYGMLDRERSLVAAASHAPHCSCGLIRGRRWPGFFRRQV